MKAIIKNGRWSCPDSGERLDPVQLHQVHNQFDRIYDFTKDVCELTHNKIEILSQILHVSPEQERAILKVLKLSTADVKLLL